MVAQDAEDEEVGAEWRRIGVWYQAIRPFTLSASVVPVVVGSVLASRYGTFNGLLFGLVLVGSLLVQSGTNLMDEYADHARGKVEGKKIQAPYKVISLGLLTPRAVLGGALLCFGLAAIIGTYLVVRTGWPLALICLASLGVAYGYSAGPWPLGNLGLGEFLVFLFMGPVMVLSSFYVQVRTLHWPAVWLSLPVGCLVTAILVVNNLRDLEEDRHSGKVTLVTLWGRQPVIWLYELLLLVAFGSVVTLVVSGVGSWVWLAPLLVLPRGVTVANMVRHGTDRAVLHQALQRTAKLHLQFGLLLSLALIPVLP
jgi:1,4-dihydroxy-2-naphthoate octaprenyltransferase